MPGTVLHADWKCETVTLYNQVDKSTLIWHWDWQIVDSLSMFMVPFMLGLVNYGDHYSIEIQEPLRARLILRFWQQFDRDSVSLPFSVEMTFLSKVYSLSPSSLLPWWWGRSTWWTYTTNTHVINGCSIHSQALLLCSSSLIVFASGTISTEATKSLLSPLFWCETVCLNSKLTRIYNALIKPKFGLKKKRDKRP